MSTFKLNANAPSWTPKTLKTNTKTCENWENEESDIKPTIPSSQKTNQDSNHKNEKSSNTNNPQIIPKIENELQKCSMSCSESKKQQKKIVFHDEREHVNIVFIGHVDAGKSTTCGRILVLTGQADDRLIAKYKELAKQKNRDSWWIAYIMDTSEEERNKGKTVEVGRALFETEKKRYTILDAPGHKNYVPAMIGGAAQADIGILVISARKGEFEAGFNRGGQTREHAMLAKTLGIIRIVVAINKMDDETVNWSEKRYNHIIKKVQPFLRQCGYREKDISFLPMSGLTGEGLMDAISSDICPWYKGNSLLKTLDQLKTIKRDPNAALRVPIIDRYKDMGCVVVLGKVESGILTLDSDLILMPSSKKVSVSNIFVDDLEVNAARCGENVSVFLKGCLDSDVHSGDILCPLDNLTPRSSLLKCQMAITELLEHKPLMTAGYLCVLHIHTASVECEIESLISIIDSKVGKKSQKVKKAPVFVRSGAQLECKIKLSNEIAVERYKDFSQLGRFTLRDEGKTIAIGIVLDLY